LTFRSHHEVFIRRSWYSVLPSLDATMLSHQERGSVTQLITALVSIHSSVAFLSDMYSFLDPPGRTVLFSVDNRSLFPVDCVIGLIRIVGECWLAIFRQTVSLYQPNEFISWNPTLLWPNGWMDEDATWYGSRPRRRPRCIRRVPSAPRKGHSTPPSFRPMSIVATVAHLCYCWALVSKILCCAHGAQYNIFWKNNVLWLKK